MNQLEENSLKVGVSTNHTWSLLRPWLGAKVPLPEYDQVWDILESAGDFSIPETE